MFRGVARLKVVAEASDIVPLLRLFDDELKRAVFREVAADWRTRVQIEARFGRAGLDVLDAFEKARVVETKWEPVDGAAQKSYRSYYTSFQFSFTVPVQDLADIVGVAVMPQKEFDQIEHELWTLAGSSGVFLKTLSERWSMPLMRLQCLLKRSARLDLRGHTVFRRSDSIAPRGLAPGKPGAPDRDETASRQE